MDKSGVKYVILGYNQTQISEKNGRLKFKIFDPVTDISGNILCLFNSLL